MRIYCVRYDALESTVWNKERQRSFESIHGTFERLLFWTARQIVLIGWYQKRLENRWCIELKGDSVDFFFLSKKLLFGSLIIDHDRSIWWILVEIFMPWNEAWFLKMLSLCDGEKKNCNKCYILHSINRKMKKSCISSRFCDFFWRLWHFFSFAYFFFPSVFTSISILDGVYNKKYLQRNVSKIWQVKGNLCTKFKMVFRSHANFSRGKIMICSGIDGKQLTREKNIN